MKLFAWNEHSEGGKALAEALGIKRIKHEGSSFRGAPHKVVINWGSTKLPDEVKKCKVINRPEVLSICTDKLKFFYYISDVDEDDLAVSIPDWTTLFDEAMKWVTEGHNVCARTVLNGHSAQGLVIMDRDNPDSLVQAPLYTKYIPKKHEFRVHVVAGEVVDVQRKAKKTDFVGEVNWKVRNLANGFIYAREGFETPECVTTQATRVVAQIGLDFGAVDIIWNEKQNKAYVLEVNTAPGLMGTTLENYAKAIKENF